MSVQNSDPTSDPQSYTLSSAQAMVWNVSTLSWQRWDGSLTTGAVTIGTVNQGTGGASAWKVDGSAVTQPVSIASSVPVTGPLTDAQIRATPLAVTGGGGGTEYTEDAPAAADPIAGAMMLIRQDVPTALVSLNGDNVAQRGTNYGAAFSQIVTSAGAFVDSFGGGTQFADGAVRGTATGTLAMGDDGVNIQSIKVDAAGELQVDVLTMPTVAVTGPLTDAQLRATPVPVSGTVTANLAAGVNNIGDVDVLTLPSLPTGANVIGALTANQSVNVTQFAGSNVVAAVAGVPRVGMTDSSGQVQYNFPAGFVRTTDEPRQIFYDPFDAALDTTNRWNAPTSAGGGVAASVTGGVLSLGSGITANGYSYLTSQASFTPTIPGWLGNSWALQLEASPIGTNAVRFWGIGAVSGSVPSSTNPLGTTGNGYGFEVDTAGALSAVVYANGVRTVVQALTVSTDGAYHRYIINYRTDRTFWYVDSLATPVATSNFNSPQIQTLPMLALTVAHSAAPAASRALTITGLAVFDSAKNNTTLSDGTFGWRKATVKAASTAVAATDSPLAVGLHPTSPLPAGTNSIGTTLGPTLTKGTQAATGYSVQPLKDAGRTAISLYASRVTSGVSATEAMVTFTRSTVAGAATSSATTFVITSGKTFRITSIIVATRNMAATTADTLFTLRINTAGATVTTSPAAMVLRAATPATINSWDRATALIHDGIEIAGNGTLQFGMSVNPTWTTTASQYDVNILGFEY